MLAADDRLGCTNSVTPFAKRWLISNNAESELFLIDRDDTTSFDNGCRLGNRKDSAKDAHNEVGYTIQQAVFRRYWRCHPAFRACVGHGRCAGTNQRFGESKQADKQTTAGRRRALRSAVAVCAVLLLALESLFGLFGL